MVDKNILLNNILQNKNKISQFGVKRLGLFGSFARNEQRESSDVDIIVEFSKGKKNIDNFMNLAFFLEKILKRKVELLTKESLSPHIGSHILEEAQFLEISN